jgi:hypothetical protein
MYVVVGFIGLSCCCHAGMMRRNFGRYTTYRIVPTTTPPKTQNMSDDHTSIRIPLLAVDPNSDVSIAYKV